MGVSGGGSGQAAAEIAAGSSGQAGLTMTVQAVRLPLQRRWLRPQPFWKAPGLKRAQGQRLQPGSAWTADW